ncbi:MAG: hypothetical protein CL607_06635 [Anaerolineaceae bacterium]|nr:hypothetical protein [Anaerolineaceae bacterium]
MIDHDYEILVTTRATSDRLRSIPDAGCFDETCFGAHVAHLHIVVDGERTPVKSYETRVFWADSQLTAIADADADIRTWLEKQTIRARQMTVVNGQ